MTNEVFLSKLKSLVDEAKNSPNRDVRASAIVLLGLSGAMKAGSDFLEAYVDHNAIMIKNQVEILKNGARN